MYSRTRRSSNEALAAHGSGGAWASNLDLKARTSRSARDTEAGLLDPFDRSLQLVKLLLNLRRLEGREHDPARARDGLELGRAHLAGHRAPDRRLQEGRDLVAAPEVLRALEVRT